MKRGFTLLEVMISLAILAVGLVSISSLNGGAVAMHAYGRRATEATLLLRSKMLDIEDDLQKKGFSDFDDERHGDFTDENPSSDYTWSAEILKPDVQLDPGQLLSAVSGGAIPGSGQPQAASGPQPVPGASPLMSGPLSGVMQNQAKAFVETLKKSVREIRLTVSWPNGKERRSISASQTIVILPESVGQTQPPPTPQTQQQTQTQTPTNPFLPPGSRQ
ncbi:MAG TPA: prepilin-type N-terminal cleavage/methylation domain-containing protein [Myxococcales bacterium]|nr:prepilin-type N-terminal cleavage/methylation domain-containing protein [Myxococcales bacterium]